MRLRDAPARQQRGEFGWMEHQTLSLTTKSIPKKNSKFSCKPTWQQWQQVWNGRHQRGLGRWRGGLAARPLTRERNPFLLFSLICNFWSVLFLTLIFLASAFLYWQQVWNGRHQRGLDRWRGVLAAQPLTREINPYPLLSPICNIELCLFSIQICLASAFLTWHLTVMC